MRCVPFRLTHRFRLRHRVSDADFAAAGNQHRKEHSKRTVAERPHFGQTSQARRSSLTGAVLRRLPSSRYDGRSMDRLTNYAALSSTLVGLTDEELATLVAKSPALHAGVG